MDFLVGFSFIFFLVIFTFLLTKISGIIPKEFAQALIVFMIFGDAIFVAIHYYGIKDIVSNIKEFKLGIAVSFALMSLLRAAYFLIANKSQFE